MLIGGFSQDPMRKPIESARKDAAWSVNRLEFMNSGDAKEQVMGNSPPRSGGATWLRTEGMVAREEEAFPANLRNLRRDTCKVKKISTCLGYQGRGHNNFIFKNWGASAGSTMYHSPLQS